MEETLVWRKPVKISLVVALWTCTQ